MDAPRRPSSALDAVDEALVEVERSEKTGRPSYFVDRLPPKMSDAFDMTPPRDPSQWEGIPPPHARPIPPNERNTPPSPMPRQLPLPHAASNVSSFDDLSVVLYGRKLTPQELSGGGAARAIGDAVARIRHLEYAVQEIRHRAASAAYWGALRVK
jgi:hypothetical protein